MSFSNKNVQEFMGFKKVNSIRKSHLSLGTPDNNKTYRSDTVSSFVWDLKVTES